MFRETVIRAVGNSAGVTIPKPMLDALHITEGDAVFLVATDGGLLITPYDPSFQDAMAIYEDVARTYRNAMRELADE